MSDSSCVNRVMQHNFTGSIGAEFNATYWESKEMMGVGGVLDMRNWLRKRQLPICWYALPFSIMIYFFNIVQWNVQWNCHVDKQRISWWWMHFCITQTANTEENWAVRAALYWTSSWWMDGQDLPFFTLDVSFFFDQVTVSLLPIVVTL